MSRGTIRRMAIALMVGGLLLVTYPAVSGGVLWDLGAICGYVCLILFVCLYVFPVRGDGLPHARLLVLTGYASIATTVQAIKAGADNYLAKPANLDSILSALEHSANDVSTDLDNVDVAVPLSVERLEWEHIQRVLAENHGNISSTARALNMHRRTLQRKLAKRPVAK